MTMEDDDAKIVFALDAVDSQSHVGKYAPLRAWREDPVLPSPGSLQLHLDEKSPVGIFLSLPKSLREGVKMSYIRNMPMPDFYQTRRYTKSHWGQRKLLLSEIEFFSLMLKDLTEEVLCVYAGAAHGGHILYLVELFPNITFHLYDPAAFNKVLVKYTKTATNPRVKIFTGADGWFDQAVADSYQPGGSNYEAKAKLLFVSDIRDAPPKQTGDNRFQARQATSQMFMEQAKVEMAMQADWARTMQADGSYLKFKLQYPKEGTAAFERYLNGTVYLQCWAPTPSSEVRLMVKKHQLSPDVYWNIPFVTGMIDYFNAAWRTEDMSRWRLVDMDIKSHGLSVDPVEVAKTDETGMEEHIEQKEHPKPREDDEEQEKQEEKQEKLAKMDEMGMKEHKEPKENQKPREDDEKQEKHEEKEEQNQSKPALDGNPGATLGQVWAPMGVPRVGGDCFIETKIWTLYLRNLSKEPVTVQNLQYRIDQATQVLAHTSGASGFHRNLNFQKPREDESYIGKPVAKDVVNQIRASTSSKKRKRKW